MVRLLTSLFVASLIIASLLKPAGAVAQTFSYASVDKDTYAEDVSFLVGRDGDDVIIWLYNKRNSTLQATLYDKDMKVLSRKDFRFKGSDAFLQLEFVRKNTARNVIIQYSSGAKIITRFFSFDKNTGAILPGKTLEEADVFASLIVKPSANNDYTGVVKGYITTLDSVLVQYSLYSKEDKLVYSSNLVLPRVGHDLYLENGLVDNSGNFFFYDITTSRDNTTQAVNLYEINIKKDSLITNEIRRQGTFSGVSIRESSLAGDAVITGMLLQPSGGSPASGPGASRYVFLQQLNQDLAPQSDMILIPFSSYDALPYVSSGLQNASFVESRDSSYLFYAGGLAYNSPLPKPGTYSTNTFSSPALLPGASGIPQQYQRPFSLYTTAMSDAFNSYAMMPVGSPVYSDYNFRDNSYSQSVTGPESIFPPQLPGAENVFLTTNMTGTRQVTSHIFKDTTSGSSAEYDFIASTGRNIQYIYSRVLKNKKQVVYAVEASPDATSQQQHPLLSKSNYHIVLNSGTQISPDAVIFPYLSIRKVGFVKLNLK